MVTGRILPKGCFATSLWARVKLASTYLLEDEKVALSVGSGQKGADPFLDSDEGWLAAVGCSWDDGDQLAWEDGNLPVTVGSALT